MVIRSLEASTWPTTITNNKELVNVINVKCIVLKKLVIAVVVVINIL